MQQCLQCTAPEPNSIAQACPSKRWCTAGSHLSLQVFIHCPDFITLGPEVPDCSGLEGHIPQGPLILTSELGLQKLGHTQLSSRAEMCDVKRQKTVVGPTTGVSQGRPNICSCCTRAHRCCGADCWQR